MSAGVATLLNKMGEPAVTVGIDGSVYRFHPQFHNLMMEKIGELVNPGIKVWIHFSNRSGFRYKNFGTFSLI